MNKPLDMDEVLKAIAMLLNLSQIDLSKLSVLRLLELHSVCREWHTLARRTLMEEVQDASERGPGHDD
jgi:CBS-domain-containing membrane protein